MLRRLAFLSLLLALTPSAAAQDNPLLADLLAKGVPMAKGDRVKLPPPLLADGLGPAAQQAALKRLERRNYTVADFARNSPVAPFILDINTLREADADGAPKGIDLYFIAHGDWRRLSSDDFLDGLFKGNTDKGSSGRLNRSHTLTAQELAERKIALPSRQGAETRFYFSSVNLFDRVEVEGTRMTTFSKSADAMVLAALVAPSFTGDAKYPNRWRSLSRTEEGELVTGEPAPYIASGFYVKATRLAAPAGAILVEYHMVFEEPTAWFGGANLIRSKLPIAVQDEVRTFRRKLAAPPPSGGAPRRS